VERTITITNTHNDRIEYEYEYVCIIDWLIDSFLRGFRMVMVEYVEYSTDNVPVEVQESQNEAQLYFLYSWKKKLNWSENDTNKTINKKKRKDIFLQASFLPSSLLPLTHKNNLLLLTAHGKTVLLFITKKVCCYFLARSK